MYFASSRKNITRNLTAFYVLANLNKISQLEVGRNFGGGDTLLPKIEKHC